MDEYIKKEVVYQQLTGVCDGYCHGKMCKFTEYMLDNLDKIPAADVQPVKRGKWVEGNVIGINYYYCSCCFYHVTAQEGVTFNYCPNCGARMNGEPLEN